jgi:hypothetical protein
MTYLDPYTQPSLPYYSQPHIESPLTPNSNDSLAPHVKLCYCIFHMTFPNQVFTFILHQVSKCHILLNSWLIPLKFKLCIHLCIILVPTHNIVYHWSTSTSCFWLPKVLLGGQAALAAAESHEITWYHVFICPNIVPRCSEISVQTGEHYVEWWL